ncbi:hypothetical protein CVT26_004355 [Gymnopilus dilepis]|uniref:Major facilitator superfamily (MFS) profile domain-containing protein n=1 Tax=Gymnopilus dilepis TaxID=231916 RepID=A0A409WU93_9AGAR|nr:hypothetical protein CVT26_004355 [Gymnopilus dilepis]
MTSSEDDLKPRKHEGLTETDLGSEHTPDTAVPDGGLRAWLVVAGVFLVQFGGNRFGEVYPAQCSPN